MIQKEINRSQPSPEGFWYQSRTQIKHIKKYWEIKFYVEK